VVAGVAPVSRSVLCGLAAAAMLTANVGGGRADIRTDVNEVWVTNEITDKTPTNSRNEFLNSPTIRNLASTLTVSVGV
jgi:pyocin large subunit-like protein